MYQNHVPLIRDWALSSPHRFLGLGAFVLLTIRQPLKITPRAVRDVAKLGRDSRWLFSHKRAGFIYLAGHQAKLLAEAQACVATGDAERAVTAFARVPNLGLAKAGFLAQCLGLPVGCLDTHNLERYGLGRSSVRLEKTLSDATKAKRISAYLGLCETLGGAETLWDSWCAYVADRQLDLFDYATPETVSALHVKATLDAWRN